MKLSTEIEALLFFKASPVSISWLSQELSKSSSEIEEAVEDLSEELNEGRGLRLMRKGNEVMLVTAPEVATLIEKIQKEELSRDLGKAGLETLAIVLYRGPVSRSEIEYIRGVNSTFTLRTLLIRGLIERISNPQDQRSFLYKPSLEALKYLGITRIEELPDFDTVKRELEAFEETSEENEHGTDTNS